MGLPIYIYSGPIRSGKTTTLLNSFAGKKQVAGFLTPDINNRRKFYELSSGQMHEFETTTGEIAIGRFRFSEKVFQLAKQIMEYAILQQPEWIILDEVGRLEIAQNSGFEPWLSQSIAWAKAQTRTKLLLVIRDTLLEEAIEKYGLKDHIAFDPAGLPQQKPYGLVLCGGMSSRMQEDKAFINYHNSPQWQYARDLLSGFCREVFLSVNAQQAVNIPSGIPMIIDAAEFVSQGPIAGLLSADKTINAASWFVLGVDYPLLAKKSLRQIRESNAPGYDAVCFQNKEGFLEPLVAQYNFSAMLKLPFMAGPCGNSVQRFLKEVNTKILSPQFPGELQSFDKPVQKANFKKSIDGNTGTEGLDRKI